MREQVEDIVVFKQAAVELLKDQGLDSDHKKLLLEKLFEERNQRRESQFKYDQAQFTGALEKRRFWHNTPFVITLVAISSWVLNRDNAWNTERLKQIESQLAEQGKTADASREATREERAFAYKIIEQELAKSGDQEGRAKLLLFLVRAGIMNGLNKNELEKMALSDLNSLGKGDEAVGIPPTLGSSEVPPNPAQFQPMISIMRFIGSATVPSDYSVDGTLVGGLSGMDYDAKADLWYLVSDDKSDKNPARFYTAKLTFGEDRLASVDIQHAVTLRQADGNVYPNTKLGGEVPDPESIRRDPETDNLWWTSEGDRRLGLSPFLRISSPNGEYAADFPTPPIFRMSKEQEIGPRHNVAFEGLSFAPDGKSIWLAMESALYQDGPISTTSAGGVTRLTHLDRDGKVLAQFAYPLDPIQAVPTGKNGDNSLSEFLALDGTRGLVLERSGVEGADGVWKMYIRIYEIDTTGATDISAMPSLAGAYYKPVSKRLTIDLAKTPDLGPIDNIEGISWGPILPDGGRSLVLVSDNNFNPAQITQFLAFEVQP